MSKLAFKLVTTCVAELSSIFDHLKEFFDTANFSVAPADNEEGSGVWTRTLDSSQVALWTFRMDPSAFETYECNRAVVIGMAIKEFHTILKNAPKDSKLTLSKKEEESYLDYVFESDDIQYDGRMALLDIETDELSIPYFEDRVEIDVDPRDFKKGITVMNVKGLTTGIFFTTTNDDFTIHTTDSMGSTKRYVIKTSNERVITKFFGEIPNPYKCEYSEQWLAKIANTALLTDTAQICLFYDGRPAVLRARINVFVKDGEARGLMECYLAPKIVDE